MATTDPFLFISHVTEDRPAALEIVDELERRGVPCWMAPRDVHPGRPYDDEIVEAIEKSRAILLIFSERCNDSDYIRREITVAGESQKLVIPFRIEDVAPRRGLRVRLTDLHWIDAFIFRERAIDQVVHTFEPAGRGEPIIPHRAQPAPETPKRPEEPRAADMDRHREDERHGPASLVPPPAGPVARRTGLPAWIMVATGLGVLVISAGLVAVLSGGFTRSTSGFTGGMQMTIEADTDRRGSDYRNFTLPSPQPELCRDACATEANCRAFTYVKPGIQGTLARCWLKTAAPAAVAHSCCASGIKQ